MDWVLLLAVLIQVESGGDINAVGDTHMQNKAYGILQVRQPCLTDVNRIADTDFTMREVRNSESLSRWVAVIYIRHYGKRYERITGNQLTLEVGARIWNGGPNGWRKDSTDPYWRKVQNEIRRHTSGN